MCLCQHSLPAQPVWWGDLYHLQKNEKQNNVSSPKSNGSTGCQGPVKIKVLKGAGPLCMIVLLNESLVTTAFVGQPVSAIMSKLALFKFSPDIFHAEMFFVVTCPTRQNWTSGHATTFPCTNDEHARSVIRECEMNSSHMLKWARLPWNAPMIKKPSPAAKLVARPVCDTSKKPSWKRFHCPLLDDRAMQIWCQLPSVMKKSSTWIILRK